MSIEYYKNSVKDDRAAKKYVSKFLLKNGHRFCPFCGSRKFWKLADKRRRCQRCKKVYHDLTRRWWNLLHLPMDTWLRIVELFASDLSEFKIAEETKLDYKKVSKALKIIRFSIFAHATDAQEFSMCDEIKWDKLSFKLKQEKNENQRNIDTIPTLKILIQDKKIHLKMSSLRIKMSSLRNRSIYDSSTYYKLEYQNECFFMNETIDYSVRNWFQNQLDKHNIIEIYSPSDLKGLEFQNLPLHLKEIEFRYNHREESLFDILVQYMSDIIPEDSKKMPQTSIKDEETVIDVIPKISENPNQNLSRNHENIAEIILEDSKKTTQTLIKDDETVTDVIPKISEKIPSYFTICWWSLVDLRMETGLEIVDLFALDLSEMEIAQRIKLHSRNVSKVLMIIRCAILAHTADFQDLLKSDEIEWDKSYFGAEQKKNEDQRAINKNLPNLYILTQGKDIHIQMSHSKLTSLPKISCNYHYDETDNKKYLITFSATPSSFNDSAQNFWNWFKKRLPKLHKIPLRYFPLYIKEMEFRYNHRKESLVDLLSEYMFDEIP